MPLMVSISGIRGIVGSDLTPDVVVRYVSAFGEFCNKGRIMIGRDGRITGKPIADLVSTTLLTMGCDVTDIGICPTPTVQMAVAKRKASGGISITASHNPIMWNGLKFLDQTGLFLDKEQNQRLWKIAETPVRSYAPWDRMGSYQSDQGYLDDHIQAIMDLPYLNVGSLRKKRFKVVVDCVNAAGGLIVPRLLKKLGCRVIEMNCDVSGVFAHDPEPIPENLKALCRRVKKEKADLGIAVDPDVDRLVLITEQGEPFGEEYSIASVVNFVLQKETARKHGRKFSKPLKVVTNLSTTRAVDDIAKGYGAESIRTPVGEINVAKRMNDTGAIVGGEGSGGIILPRIHIGRDAPVGIGLVLQHLAEFGGTLSELKATMPQYAITKSKIQLGSMKPDDVLSRVREQCSKEGRMTFDDGLKLDFADSWVHLRTSNTEPILRIIAESSTKAEADALVQRFSSLIAGFV